MVELSPTKQLDGFIDKFTPDIAKQARAAVKIMRALLPTANVLVYDNYNALAIGFAPGERTSDAIFSIAVFPRWVSLFFLQNGQKLKDPNKLLEGSGNQARHIKLRDVRQLEDRDVRTLMDAALNLAKTPLPSSGKGKLIIKTISAKQRPRRP
jgi:hypothetical protein